MEFMSDIGSGADIYRPSLFELIAQEKLRALIQPAARYVLSVNIIFKFFYACW
jgi:hypothetical protein